MPIQSKRFLQYEEECLWFLKQYPKLGKGEFKLTAKYHMPNRQAWPDLLGLLQATADILEKAEIIEDDKYIKSFDGSEIAGIDKDNPRAEIIIERVK